MNITVEKLCEEDLISAMEIWNEIVEQGIAFPQMEILDENAARGFFSSQTLTAVAKLNNTEVVGLYILHPNNVGRCAHIANTSYAVTAKKRGLGVGEILVKDSIKKAKECGFKILQFNAVVASNNTALKLYKKLGFTQLGLIPKGFLMPDGNYEDIIPHYIEL
ncbi:MAG: GNAT family N-acetyltransferase [Cardiobacteriaceae bacterium]|nr:GNAT family N-acetyltransferase [Cardiobacteriaceae bacterium]